MNIALLSYEYPPETGFGGIGTYSYYHARALVKLGHRVHVFAGSTRPGVFTSEHDGVIVTRVKRDGWLKALLKPADKWRCHWFHNRVENAYTMYAALRPVLRRERFDVVEAPECGGDGSAVGALLGVPLAIRFHSPAALVMETYPVPRRDRILTSFVEGLGINAARIRTSCSRFLADEVMHKMGVPAPVHVIPNGIDVQLFDRDPGVDVEQRFGLRRDGLTVFFANRLEERKGIHLIADIATAIMQRHRHVRFVLAGRDLFGYVANQVMPRMQAGGFADRFHVLGGQDLPTVRALLRFADIFLLPSLWENCPYSCLEAMTAGLAIVSSDCGGMPELISHGNNGLLARNGDAASYIERLDEMIQSDTVRHQMGRAARGTVEARLTDVDVARQTVEIYRQVAGGGA